MIEGLRYASILLSTAFCIWLSACVVIACVRISLLHPQYRRWPGLGEAERRTLVFTPSVLGLAYWSDYQRFNWLRNVLINSWPAVDDPITLVHLVFGAAGVSGILWVMLCSVFGESIGHQAWLRAVGLGMGLGLLVALTSGGSP